MKRSDSGLRILFFLSVFCVTGLIVYFALGRIYGYGGSYSSTGKSNAIRRLFPRSENEFEFLIIVFGWRRMNSLERLVKSLLAADYANETVNLQFNVEFEPSEEVRDLVQATKWPFGKKSIIWRKMRYGLERMVVNSWNATNDKEFAFFFEDDIEAHPQFFKFALEAIKQPEIINNPDLVGIGFNTPRYDEINVQHSIWNHVTVIGSDSKLFYFQLPCSWGALYFPWKWREYLHYYKTRHADSRQLSTKKAVIPKTYVTNWAQSWKKFYIEMMVLKGYVMLYPSLPRQEGFSVNHREEGEHTGKTTGLGLAEVVDYFTCPFATTEQVSLLIEALGKGVTALPVVNIYHSLSNMPALKEFGKIIQRARRLGKTYE